MGERVEDRNEPVHRIERKSGDGRYVTSREEARLEEEEKEESGAEVGQGEWAIRRPGLRGGGGRGFNGR